MTNEQLATFIKQGGADDLKPALWERTKHLLYKLVGQHYRQYTERFTACGVELADLRQECYGVFIKALDSYKPDKQALFTSYFNFHVLNVVNDMLGIRNKNVQNNRPLDNCTSLDKPIEGADDITVGESIEDTKALQEFNEVADSSHDEYISRVLHEEIDKLEPVMRDVVVAHWFESKTLTACSKDLGFSCSRAQQLSAKALRKLRTKQAIKALGDELGYTSHYVYHDGYGAFQQHGITHLEEIAMKRADLLARVEGG